MPWITCVKGGNDLETQLEVKLLEQVSAARAADKWVDSELPPFTSGFRTVVGYQPQQSIIKLFILLSEMLNSPLAVWIHVDSVGFAGIPEIEVRQQKMLLCFFDYCGCSYHLRTANPPSFLPSQLCCLGEPSKLCFQISKVRTEKQRGALLLLMQKMGRLPPRLFICVLFWVPKFDDTELPFFIISIDWVFPLFFLLCYP